MFTNEKILSKCHDYKHDSKLSRDKKKIRVDVKKKGESRVRETADHLNSWRRDEEIAQKVWEMSHACRSVFTISSAFISSFLGRKMSSDLQDIVRRVVENLSNIQPANSAATSSSEGCQNFTNATDVQELNRCFQVPRLPAPNSSVLQQSSVWSWLGCWILKQTKL